MRELRNVVSATTTSWIEQGRLALLRVDFFRGSVEAPSKSLHVDPGEIVDVGTILKPRRMWMRQHGRDAETEVEFVRIESDVAIADRVFSAMRLEQPVRNLYSVVEQLDDGSAP